MPHGGVAVGKVVHAVVVHAHLHLLVGGTVAGIGLPGRQPARHAHRIAPHECRHGRVTLGHPQAISRSRSHTLETDARPGHSGAGGAAGECGSHATQRRQQPGEGARQPAPEHGTPRRVAHVVNAGVGAAVAVLHRVEVFGHGVLLRLRTCRRTSLRWFHDRAMKALTLYWNCVSSPSACHQF